MLLNVRMMNVLTHGATKGCLRGASRKPMNPKRFPRLKICKLCCVVSLIMRRIMAFELLGIHQENESSF